MKEATAPVSPAPLIGRDAELHRLRAALHTTATGEGAVIVIRGEPGLGKTALISALTDEADGFTLLRCRGVETEAELPFSGLHELLLPLLADADTLPADQHAALQASLSMADAQPTSIVHTSMAALTLIAAAATTQPVLLIADDLHWMDDPTLVVLRFLARRIAHDRVMVLAAERAGHRTLEPIAETLELEPLSASDVQHFASVLAAGPLVPDAGRAIAGATGGNPLAIIETVRLLGNDVDRLGTMLDEPVQPGALIERGFASRLADLAPETRQALAVVATAFTDSADVVTQALAHLGLPATALDAAERAGVMVRQLDNLRFSHPLLRALVFHEAPPADRRRYHAALASSATERGVRAWHAASACSKASADVADELAAAAADFEARGGIVAAAQALERAAGLTPERVTRAKRLLDAGHAARRAGRARWAAGLLDQALALTTPDRTSALTIEIEIERLSLDAHSGSFDDLIGRQRALAEAAKSLGPDIACDAFANLAYEGVLQRDSQVARDAMLRTEALVDQASPAVRTDTLVLRAIAQITTGDAPAVGTASLRDIVRSRIAPGSSAPEQHSDVVAADYLWTLGEEELCCALLSRLVSTSRQRGDMITMIGALGTDALIRVRRGDWAGADTLLDQAVQLAETRRLAWYHTAITVRVGYLRALQGHADALTIPRWLREATEGQSRPFRDQVNTAHGMYYLGAGDAARAAGCFQEISDLFCAGSMDGPTVVPWPGELVEAYALAGDQASALAGLADFRARWKAVPTPWSRAVEARLEGLLAADDDYADAFERALREHATVVAPFDEARTHLHYGRRLRRAGKRAKAAEHLGRALAVFDQLGARGWSEQTSSELEAAGVRRAPSSPDVAHLTSQERVVADCIAEGMTNKEAAAQLFLTPKTIEWHLRQIYRKLGIKSRLQLAAHVQEARRL